MPLIEPPPVLFQCHSLRWGPLSFNPTRKGRFNAPDGEYGTTYLSTTPEGAFVEKFVQDAPRDGSGRPLLTRSRLDANCLCQIAYQPGPARTLRLVDLSGAGSVLIGTTGELCSLADIARLPLVRRWALRLYQHPDRPDGIYYRARHDQSRISIALFDRAAGVLTADCATNILTLDDPFTAILTHYDVTVIDDTAGP